MNVCQLTTNRFQISLRSIQSDPTINQNIKQMFKNISECILENSFNIQLIQSELISKSNSIELNYGLSQKLSVVEFLEYFKKVQNIIQIVQANQKKQQNKLVALVEQNERKISRMEQSLGIKQKQCERKKKIEELEHESVRNELSQLMKKYQRIKERMQVWQMEKQRINKNMNSIHTEGVIEKNEKIMNQIKQIKIYSEEMKDNIEQLLHKCNNSSSKHEKLVEMINHLKDQMSIKDGGSLASTSIGNRYKNNTFDCKYITFSQLRQVLSNLQYNLTISLNTYANNLFAKSTNLKKCQIQHINQNQTVQLFDEGQFLYQLDESVPQSSSKQMQVWAETSKTSASNIEQNFNEKKNNRKDSQLNSNFNYKNFNLQSRKQNINELEQSRKYSITLQWIYFHQDPILNYNSKSPQNFHRVKFIDGKELNDKDINQNHNLGYTFSKQSAYMQKQNQSFVSPLILNSSVCSQNLSPFYTIKEYSIVINQRGFYQIRCGLLPIYPVQVKIFSMGVPIASHNFYQISKNGVCRAIMIYIRINDKPSQIMIESRSIQNENVSRNADKDRESSKKKQKSNISYGRRFEPLSGFICIQRLS